MTDEIWVAEELWYDMGDKQYKWVQVTTFDFEDSAKYWLLSRGERTNRVRRFVPDYGGKAVPPAPEEKP